MIVPFFSRCLRCFLDSKQHNEPSVAPACLKGDASEALPRGTGIGNGAHLPRRGVAAACDVTKG